MKTFTIKAEVFLEWYFNAGDDDEIKDARETMGERVIDSLINVGQSLITIDDMFEEAQFDSLPIRLLEEFSDDEEGYTATYYLETIEIY